MTWALGPTVRAFRVRRGRLVMAAVRSAVLRASRSCSSPQLHARSDTTPPTRSRSCPAPSAGRPGSTHTTTADHKARPRFSWT